MTLKEAEFFEVATPTGPMRVHSFQPAASAPAPTVILYSEIFQVTGPIRRLAARVAGEDFEVLVPEIYHEYEEAGTVLAYDKAGTDRGNFLKHEKPIEAFDSDAKAVIDWALARPSPWKKVGTLGFCIGGHLAFRAALHPGVAAASCFYPTDIHAGSLGRGKQDGTLGRIREIEAELLLIWGRQDPHVPLEGRRTVYDALTAAERWFQWHEFNAAHAFARDEGLRYDAAATRLALDMTIELFQRRLKSA